MPGLLQLCEEILRRRSEGRASYSKLLPRLFRRVAADLRMRGWDPTELDTLRALYDVNRDTPAAPRPFPWLYPENPDGRATAWVALDDRT